MFSSLFSHKCAVKSECNIFCTLTSFAALLISLRELMSELCLLLQQLVNVSVEFLLP